ncbi:tetratricopeptide repeat protein [Chroococcidiopsis sp. FACHB-1243]|uniref:protein kinase domain-containing protein n=1 Tax=Chroococcidiopsis sp. [FACHB-1243] TaxID=2692781 RepID=UPI00177B7E60|nr:tetratricopeptide repeat protein [Chroococcidiopsis sp. [FACHB-1243]]
MKYCINPWCRQRLNLDEAQLCHSCGTQLLINGQFRLLEPLRSLDDSDRVEIFEVVDEKGTWLDPPGTHKVMKVLNSSNSKLVELLEREASVLQLIDNPGIPRVDIDEFFDFQPNGNSPLLRCLVMEKIPGLNLADWIELNGKISQTQAINWLDQIVKILEQLHGQGFFHRDIKPSNIILTPENKLVLIDFGAVRDTTNTYLAKISRDVNHIMGASKFYDVTVIRTAGYTPIEQINGKAVPQSDFFALGRTFVHLLTGISVLDLPQNSKTGQLIWRNKAPQIDRPLANLIDDLMAHLPGNRPQNARIVLQRIGKIPFESKIARLKRSKVLIPIIASLIGIGFLPLHQVVSWAISNYYFNQAYRHQNHPVAAKSFYQLAIKFNSKDVDARNNLALVCQQLQDKSCVLDNYQKSFELAPDNWEGRFGLGSYYDELGEYASAEKQYRLAITNSNGRAKQAINNLSRLKILQKHYDEAIDLVRTGLNDSNGNEIQATLYKNIGWAELERKQYAVAEQYLQRSLELNSQRADAYCLLARLAEATARDPRANWEACLLLNSRLPEVQVWRQKFLDRIWQNKSLLRKYR